MDHCDLSEESFMFKIKQGVHLYILYINKWNGFARLRIDLSSARLHRGL